MAHLTDGGSPHFSGGSHQSVLLVSDSPDERDMYAAAFQLYGFHILKACTADEAYHLACELSPAIVITDIRLPGTEGGLELTRRLKHSRATQEMPVVVLTAETVTVAPGAALSSGCDLLLVKPCLPDTLSAAARELIERGPVRRASEAVGEQNIERPHPG